MTARPGQREGKRCRAEHVSINGDVMRCDLKAKHKGAHSHAKVMTVIRKR